MVNRLKKYEDALIGLADFNCGDEVNSTYFEEPGSSQIARDILGKRICNQYLKKKGAIK